MYMYINPKDFSLGLNCENLHASTGTASRRALYHATVMSYAGSLLCRFRPDCISRLIDMPREGEKFAKEARQTFSTQRQFWNYGCGGIKGIPTVYSLPICTNCGGTLSAELNHVFFFTSKTISAKKSIYYQNEYFHTMGLQGENIWPILHIIV